MIRMRLPYRFEFLKKQGRAGAAMPPAIHAILLSRSRVSHLLIGAGLGL